MDDDKPHCKGDQGVERGNLQDMFNQSVESKASRDEKSKMS